MIFTVIGLWMVMAVITFLIVCLLAFMFNTKWISDKDGAAFYTSLVMFVVFLELIISITFVTFANNPEEYGYTRIEQNVETEET